MKKSNYYVISIYIFIILFTILNLFVKNIFTDNVIILFLIGLILLSYFVVGFEKNKNIMTKDIILSIIMYVISYYLIVYMIGFFIGFYNNVYSTKIINIIKNITPVVILIILKELLRYMLNSRSKDKYSIMVLSILAFTLLDNTILVSSLIKDSNISGTNILDYMGIIILPSLTTNILLTYLTTKIGYKPCILYRLLMELPVYIIPIYPNFGTYLEAVIKISLPIIVYIKIYKIIEKTKIKTNVILEKKSFLNTFRVGVILFTVLIVYLISGKFKYQALVIATGSMQPVIDIGDVVIVKKLSKENIGNLKKDDILAYRKDNVIVCHRIINIIKSGKYVYFETKGDYNNSADDFLVTSDQVIGTVGLKIPYIGYPSIAMNQILSRS